MLRCAKHYLLAVKIRRLGELTTMPMMDIDLPGDVHDEAGMTSDAPG
jgi:hypothetical protein